MDTSVGMTRWNEGCLFSHSSRLSSLGALGPVSILCVLGSSTIMRLEDEGAEGMDFLEGSPPLVYKVE